MSKKNRYIVVCIVCCIAFIVAYTQLPTHAAIFPAPGATIEATGNTGTGGAPWRLYSDGTLVVDDGTINWSGGASPWSAHSADIYRIIFTGPIVAGPHISSLFRALLNVETITGLEYFNTTNVTNMNSLFHSSVSLTGIGDLSGWDTSNVTRMDFMFSGASSLANGVDISGWDTSNVTTMDRMFNSASALTSLDLSNWDTGSAIDLSQMFRDASNLVSAGDLSGWDTSSAIHISSMFYGTNSLTSLNLTGWDISNATSMNNMFRESGVTAITGISGWDTSNITIMSGLFLNASNLAHLDLSLWDTSSVVDMGFMFSDTLSLTSIGDVTGWDTGNVTNMERMFRRATGLSSLDLSGWDMSAAGDTFQMFSGATGIRTLALGAEFRANATGSSTLPAVPNNAVYTGMWQNIGTGTIGDPQGAYVLTSVELMARYGSGGTPSIDTWVWQPRYPIPAPTATPMPTLTPSPTPIPDMSTPTPTPTAVPTPTATPSATPSATPTAMPSTPTPTSTPVASPTPTPSITPTPTPVATPAPISTHTPIPIYTPSQATTPTPSAPYVLPPTPTPTSLPHPTLTPTPAPSHPPTLQRHYAYIIGFSDGTVRPGALLTRAQAATIFFRIMGDNDRTVYWAQDNPFSDVGINQWFNNAVSTVTNAGLITGMPGGTFEPNRPITRAQLAVIVARHSGIYDNTAPLFIDIAGHWAEGYINAVAQQGWVVGYEGPGGRFLPNQPITRAEAAAIINRMRGCLPHGAQALLPDMRMFADNINPMAWYYLYIQAAANSHKYVLVDDVNHETWVYLLLPERPWHLLELPGSQPWYIFGSYK